MFRNIFSNKTNRFIYMAPSNKPHQIADEAAAAIEAHEKEPVSSEGLKEEARQLSANIDSYAKDIQRDLNEVNILEEAKAFDLMKPETYRYMRGDDTLQEVWVTLNRLHEAKQALQATASRSKEENRTNLEYARIMMESAKQFYKAAVADLFKEGNPLSANLYEAELRDVPRAKPSRDTTTVERVKSRWGRIADLVDEYGDLEPMSAERKKRMKEEKPKEYAKLVQAEKANDARRKEVTKELIALAQDVMEPGATEGAGEDIKIINNPGESEYTFVLNKTGRLQGSPARRWTRTVKVDAKDI